MEARSNVTRWGRGAVAEEAEAPPACLKNSSHAGGGVALSCTSHRLPFVVSGPVVRLMTSVRVSPVGPVLLLLGSTGAVVSCSPFPFIGRSFVFKDSRVDQRPIPTGTISPRVKVSVIRRRPRRQRHELRN